MRTYYITLKVLYVTKSGVYSATHTRKVALRRTKNTHLNQIYITTRMARSFFPDGTLYFLFVKEKRNSLTDRGGPVFA